MAIFTLTESAKNDLKNIARFTQKRWMIAFTNLQVTLPPGELAMKLKSDTTNSRREAI